MSPGLVQDGTKCGNNKVAKRINCNCLDCISHHVPCLLQCTALL